MRRHTLVTVCVSVSHSQSCWAPVEQSFIKARYGCWSKQGARALGLVGAGLESAGMRRDGSRVAGVAARLEPRLARVWGKGQASGVRGMSLRPPSPPPCLPSTPPPQHRLPKPNTLAVAPLPHPKEWAPSAAGEQRRRSSSRTDKKVVDAAWGTLGVQCTRPGSRLPDCREGWVEGISGRHMRVRGVG